MYCWVLNFVMKINRDTLGVLFGAIMTIYTPRNGSGWGTCMAQLAGLGNRSRVNPFDPFDPVNFLCHF